MRRLLLLLLYCRCALTAKYPNEIVDTPTVLCEPEAIVIKLKTTSSNPSHLYADEFPEDADCSARNMNRISIPLGQCGMTAETSEAGTIQRVCVSVQLHPLFVTEADRSYCAQCVYVSTTVLDDFEQSLDISEAPPTELEPSFDLQSDPPKCKYAIRKGSATGPEIHYASVGDRVFHVWQCEGEGTGILVQNCYVEDGQGNRILIVDQNGCGVDHYVMSTPQYSSDLSTAFQETKVFKFAGKTITRFSCQIRLCLKGEDCKKLSPPTSCPTLDDRLAAAKKLKDDPQPALKQIYQRIDPKETGKDTKMKKERINANNTMNNRHESKQAKPAAVTREPPREPRRANATGSIYYGFSNRNRRQLDGERPRFTTSRGYPELDVVGELRVLETPDDVRYFESRQSREDCVSALTYTLLVSALSVMSILLLTLVLFISAKSAGYKNRVLRFNH